MPDTDDIGLTLQDAAHIFAMLNDGVLSEELKKDIVELFVREGCHPQQCPDGFGCDENGLFSQEDPSNRIPFTFITDAEFCSRFEKSSQPVF